MNHRIKIAALLIITSLLLITISIFYSKVSIVDVDQNYHDKPIGEIRGNRSIGQVFVAQEDGLTAISIPLATYQRNNTEPVIFKLRTGPRFETDIVALTVDARGIVDNQYYNFSFNTIKDSKGRSYYFFLESPNSTKGNAITAWYSSTDVYNEGSAYINHKPIEGDLQFRTYHIRRLSLQNLYNRVLNDKPFFGFYSASIGVLVLLMLLIVKKLKVS